MSPDTVRRWLYRHRRANRVARFLGAVQGRLAAAGIGPSWLVLVEVTGRRSGKAISFPAAIADQRSPILRWYLQRAPGARAHIPVDRQAPVAAFVPIAAQYRVFRIAAAKEAACP